MADVGARKQRNQLEFTPTEPNRLVSEEQMVYLASYEQLSAAAKTDRYCNGVDIASRLATS